MFIKDNNSDLESITSRTRTESIDFTTKPKSDFNKNKKIILTS
jgi:hypothetical protein